MTGDKTRQKRNGPGGSGCFHAFCYFLARPAEGFARRRPAGADLVHDSPQNLALSSTGTTSLGLKAPPASRTWCFTPRKTLLFRQRAPCLWDQRRSAGADLVHDSSQNPVLSSTGTTSLGPKAPPASDPIIISPRGKELTTNALSLPFVVNSNHSFTPPALICILRRKN